MNDQSITRFLAHAADAVGQHDPAEALRLARLACIRLEIELGVPSSFSAAAQARLACDSAQLPTGPLPPCGHGECIEVDKPYDPAERASWSPCVCWLDPTGCTAHAAPEAVPAPSTLLVTPDPRWGIDDICPWHHSEAVLAEVERETVVDTATDSKRIIYTVLRCPDKGCGRVRGTRRTVVRP